MVPQIFSFFSSGVGDIVSLLADFSTAVNFPHLSFLFAMPILAFIFRMVGIHLGFNRRDGD